MLKIIIPAAGDGKRFKEAGYEDPKPLIKVSGETPMLKMVYDDITPKDGTYPEIIVIHRLDEQLPFAINLHSHKLSKPTEGALQTLLSVRPLIGIDEPILIANCDQLTDLDIKKFIEVGNSVDGAVATFRSKKEHHSYVKVGKKTGEIEEIAEKEVISNFAVTGVYYFKYARQFFKAAQQVIDKKSKVKGEYYLSSAIAVMLEDGVKLRPYECNTAILGTPEELQLFEMAVKVAKK